MRKVLLILSLGLLLLPLFAQIELPRPDFSPFSINKALPGLKMGHSMGFEAGASSGGAGYYLSRYTNHLHYQLNPKLNLNLNLNFVNFGSMQSFRNFSLGDDNKNKVLPDFSLRYQPSESFSLELKVGRAILGDRLYHRSHGAQLWD